MIREKLRKWIVVANGTDARIYLQHNNENTLTLIEEFHTEKARLRAVETESDKEGRVFESAVPGLHAYEPRTPLHREAKIEFARKIMEYVNRGASNHAFERLILAASPQMLGELREHRNVQAEQKTLMEVNKDLTHVREEEIPGILRNEAND